MNALGNVKAGDTRQKGEQGEKDEKGQKGMFKRTHVGDHIPL